MSHFLDRARVHVEHAIEHTKNLASDLASKFEREMHSHTHLGAFCHALHSTIHNRFHSFAPPRTQNGAKWFVDGCSYFYALSVAIEQAQSQIWIMDWWLSPELYLRRPPSKNENYRLDRMLKAAAERGVKINVMVYKEVEKVLSREFDCLCLLWSYSPAFSSLEL
jgi:phospholipase D1/2